jgi:cellobiose phosphorylase
MTNNHTRTLKFTSPEGNFTLDAPHKTSHLYFPLVNDAGMMSVVTPTLHGDAKIGQHAFLLTPASVDDLHANRYSRNFWVSINHTEAWSATGSSVKQISQNDDSVTLEAGFLWQRVIRENQYLGLRAEITSVVPSTPDHVELMAIKLTNVSDHEVLVTATAAIPIFGRSADNLRDHRHVTAILHRTRCEKYGVTVKPTLSFDERGHHPNAITYAVLGVEGDGTAPDGFYPVIEKFIGEGGTLDWPEAILQPGIKSSPAGSEVAGYEALGGLQFRPWVLHPSEAKVYVIILAILAEGDDPERIINTYGSELKFITHLEQTKLSWKSRLATLNFKTGDPQFDYWARWVALQPILRRILGNSFLPYHDYGRGGRGWRDLWQDILALLLMENEPVDNILSGYFAGIRLDGSNATIIGKEPGEFKADRNNIPRVWMDHGAWPFITSMLYVGQTGDIDFLLRKQVYFKDAHAYRCTKQDAEWNDASGTVQRTQDGSIYQGTILEHILVQHLSAFFHVGGHNNILLEGADWNDGMDMARERGESVAFTAMYADNLQKLSWLAVELAKRGVYEIEIAAEMLPLLDTINQPVDYSSTEAKNHHLENYFWRVSGKITGRKVRVGTNLVADDLRKKADWLSANLRKEEWLVNSEGFGWFNGYYDNDGVKLEGDHPNGVRMTLTGQVFTLMGYVATDEQAREQVRSADKYLYSPELRGYRLNTNFNEVKLNMGRCFGYAFGHKENGAVFNHMAVMFAYALYERGFVPEGFKVLDGIFQQSIDFPVSRMYPGIPEYINNQGRGMYPYLTGSASWYLLTMVTQVFGVVGILGDLALTPKLVRAQFDQDGEAQVETLFAGRLLEVTYKNPLRLDYRNYQVGKITLDNELVTGQERSGKIVIPRSVITNLSQTDPHQLQVQLIEKSC